MPRIKKQSMGSYLPTSHELAAYRWCINNGIFISPFATGEGTWYVEIKINNKTNRSPLTYGPTSIWIQMYEFYKYYYNKYAQKI
tara:strand:+ start:163 stop:414 length:252 start_codon:yes stop_codon:yes gene_type:complete